MGGEEGIVKWADKSLIIVKTSFESKKSSNFAK